MWAGISETAQEALGLGHLGLELCSQMWSWGPGLAGGWKVPCEMRLPREGMPADCTDHRGQGLPGAKKRCFVFITRVSLYPPGQPIIACTPWALWGQSCIFYSQVPKENSNVTAEEVEHVVFLFFVFWGFTGEMAAGIPSSTRGFWEILFHCGQSMLVQLPFPTPLSAPRIPPADTPVPWICILPRDLSRALQLSCLALQTGEGWLLTTEKSS